jgi:hypothetical protein
MGNEFIEEGVLAPGASKEADFVDSEGGETAAYGMLAPLYIYVMGWISYVDANKTPRRTVFCRRYNKGLKRFVPVENPDYERDD